MSFEKETFSPETFPSETIDLSHLESVHEIDSVPELGLKPNTWKFVSQGTMTEVTANDGIKHIVSDGFGKCSALIIHNIEDNSYTFAHLQPMDDELYARLQSQERDQSDAVIISGSHSSSQHDIKRLLSSQNTDVQMIQVETGNTPFGVSLDTSNRSISVLRAQPTQSLLIYNDLLSASEK